MSTIPPISFPAWQTVASVPPVPGQDFASSVSSWAAITRMSVIVLTLVLVALPAVWRRDPERRDAAYRVLDRILSTFE